MVPSMLVVVVVDVVEEVVDVVAVVVDEVVVEGAVVGTSSSKPVYLETALKPPP